MTDAFWRHRSNADPDIIGKKIRVDGNPTTVIGVLPPDFRFLSSEARLYFPLASRLEDRAAKQRHSGGNSIQMIARLRPVIPLAQAQEQIDAQNSRLEVDDPQSKMIADAGFRSLVVQLHTDHVASIRPTLLLLQAGALALLLIGTVNLGNLFLVRADSRAKEHAVRQALGASRKHIASEVLVETTLLTLGGGLLGLLVAAGGIRLLSVLGAESLPLGSQIVFDAHLAMVALAAAITLGVLLAVPIAWLNLRRPLGDALQSEGRTGTSARAKSISAPKFRRIAGCIGLHAAGGRWPAWHQSAALNGCFSWIPPRPHAHRKDRIAVQRLCRRYRQGSL
jgi:FtsX-like permease family